MLNEKREYEEYIKDLKETDKSPRLQTNIFFKKQKDTINIKCTGISRPLTIIARHHLFNGDVKYNEASPEERKELRKKITTELSTWCFEGVLHNYYENYANKLPKNEKLTAEYFESLWNTFKKKKKTAWSSTNIYRPLAGNTPSHYAINFPIIIAEAICSGPLKVKYLKIKKDFEKKITIQTKTTREAAEKEKVPPSEKSISFFNKKGVIGTKGQKYRDKFLKEISACLLAADNTTDYVSIIKTDLANWMAYPSFENNGAIDEINFYYKKEADANEEPLFETKNNKYRINQNLLKDFEISIIDEVELEKLKTLKNSDYIIFEDNGSGTNSLNEVAL